MGFFTPIRIVKVRALEDCDWVTHVMKKGGVYELTSDHAEELAGRGVVEMWKEPQAAVKPTSKAEKRG